VSNKRLYRVKANQMVGGVCSGIGAFLGIDPLIVRILFVAVALLSGTGLFVYLVLWILIPEAEAEYANQDEMVKRNTQEVGQRLRSLAQQFGQTISGKSTNPWNEQTQSQTLIIGLVILGLGVIILMNNLGVLSWLRFDKFWPVFLILVGVMMLVNNLRNRR